MILAIVDFEVAAKDRDAALRVLRQDATRATALPGNLSFRVFTNAGSDTHVGLMHEWDRIDAFNTYLASADFAQVGTVLRPLMTGIPVSRRLVTELFEQVKG
jgi:quinol monooxygenase YgiN